MKNSCDIVIPVYNAPEWLELCIEAVYLSDINGYLNNVIIVDDCSNDETKQLIRELSKKHKNIVALENTKNLGFVKTCNKGLKATKADNIMLLNSDCLLAEDSIKKMVDILSKDLKCGLISPLSNNAANLSIDIPEGYDYIKFDKLLEKRFKGKSFKACTIIGNCLIITRDCYEKVGNLDEAYGRGYGEETDYQYRAVELGYKAVIAIDTYVFHKAEVSYNSFSDADVLRKKNRDLFLSKWGDQYNKDIKKYLKNDPVKYVKKRLKKNDYKDLIKYESIVFDKSYINKVNALNYNNKASNKQTGATINYPKGLFRRLRVLFRKSKELYKKRGGRFLIGKIIYYITRRMGIYYELTPVHDPKPAYFNDFLFLYDDKIAKIAANEYVEKLGYYNVSAVSISIENINPGSIKNYRGFVFVNCLLNEIVEDFISIAEKLNKTVYKINSSEQQFNTGLELKEYLYKTIKKNIAFILPSLLVCGGYNVVVKHCEILQKNGCDVFIINMSDEEDTAFSNGREIPVISYKTNGIEGQINAVVATMCLTVKCMDSMTGIGEKYYLVQGFETEFFNKNDTLNRMEANSSYCRNDLKYLTVSAWCRDWLISDFKQSPNFIKNGIDIALFNESKRDYTKKITILIEGDCSIDFRNVDEAFTITNKLDRDRFEVIYLSYMGYPKNWYKYDKLFHKVPYEQVAEIYKNAHILIKTSLFESFSYPILEMMATGGVVIAIANDGNKEFAIDNYNCLIYKHGNIIEALDKIESVLKDEDLRNKLIINGIETAKERSWINIESDIIKAYM
ncbi:MAG: glycosyltransferase [Oscillospiraceae bacterium]|jgi:GT2 family glycosyltransferase|nr:glycosyltransferase [Oscillospiraceae bacterium]